jgi:TIR domain
MELAGLPAGIYRPVADLAAAELGRQQVAVDTKQGKALVEPTAQLNQTSEPVARDEARVPLNAFLSYWHEDKKTKAIFQQNLTVMTRKKLITPWHDGLIEPGMRWREEIKENLAKMDVFVGLLTTAFLASDFIWDEEVKAALKKLQEQRKDFLFVLILVDDISLEGLDLAEYQILKPGGKAVCKHPSRREGFNVAQEELAQLILKRQVVKKAQHDELAFEPRATRTQEKEGITIIVQGDYVGRDKPMTHDDHSIHIGGNVTNAQVGATLTNCTNMIQQQAPGERKNLLEDLNKQVQQLLAALPAEKQEKAAGNLELAVKAATSAEPDREWYSVSTKGLLEASTFVKDFSGNIAGTIKNLGKSLWPDFLLLESE